MPDEAWAMSWPDAMALLRYWFKNPPTHELVAAFVGHKAPSDDDLAMAEATADALAQPHSAAEFEALLASYGLPTVSTLQ